LQFLGIVLLLERDDLFKRELQKPGKLLVTFYLTRLNQHQDKYTFFQLR